MMSSWKKRIGLSLMVILLVGGVYGYRNMSHFSYTGAGFVAHTVCSCVHVAKRTEASCTADMPSAASWASIAQIDAGGARGVRATVPFLADRSALHRPGFGCILQ